MLKYLNDLYLEGSEKGWGYTKGHRSQLEGALNAHIWTIRATQLVTVTDRNLWNKNVYTNINN